MILAPTNRRIIRPYDKPSFEHTQRYGLIKGHPLGPAGGLVLYPIMNEGSGPTVFDLSGNGNTGTFNGDIIWSPGKFGPAPDFAGDADYITAGMPPGIVNAITYVLWFKSDLGNGDAPQMLLRVKNTGIIMDYGDFAWYPDLDLAPVDYSYTFVVGVWYQVAVTQSGTSYTMYINGVLVKSGTTNALDLLQATYNVNIGNLNAASGAWDFDGQIDIPSIYNRVLSTSEVSQLYREPFCMVQRESGIIYSFAPTEGMAAEITESASADDTETSTGIFNSVITESANATDVQSYPPAADWIGIDSSHLDSHCGDYGTHILKDTLDGTEYWSHHVDETHWFILYLGQTYNVTKVRGRSLTVWDPIDVNIYVSDDKENWGDAVASGISVFQDTDTWAEAIVTGKSGWYLKVEIVDTEHVDNWIGFGSDPYFTIFDVYGVIGGPPPAEITETTNATDTQNGLRILSAEITESASASDSTDGSRFHSSTIAEAANATDAQSCLLIQHSAIVESADADDEESAVGIFNSAIVESAVADDEESAVGIFNSAIVESAAADDEESAVSIFNSAIVESADATDVQSYPAVFVAEIIEVASAIDETYIVYTEIPPFMEADLIDPYASGAWLWLVQIAVPTKDTVKIARNTEDVHYDGGDFEKFNLEIGEQVFSGDGSIPRITLRTFQDSTRQIENIINETEGALGGTVKLIRVNEEWLTSPVAALEADYDLLASESDSEWCTFTIGIPNPLTQRYPLIDFCSSVCPWTSPELFKGPECQCVHADTTCTGTYDDCLSKGNETRWGGELGLSPSVVKESRQW